MPYEFTAEDFAKFTEDVIGTNGDQAQLSTILSDMQGTIVDNIGIRGNLEKEMENTREENKRLKDANMQLMMRLGQKSIEESNQPEKEEKLERGKNVDNYLEKFYEEDK